MIKFKLTIFAMPFAFTGAFLGDRGFPQLQVFLWVILAMVGARTSAMGFNRIVDRKFDAANPRTVDRAIPAGDVKISEAWLMVIVAGVLFFFSCYMLNSLTLYLSPLALFLTFFYSYTKRFTSFCHIILGLALSLSPLGGWVAVTGTLSNYPYALSLGVLFWVAGFDTIYACLDTEFDKKAQLHSLPSRIGPVNAFRLAGIFHILAFVLFILTGIQAGLNGIYYLGVAGAALALFYQHMLVRPTDLTRIHAAFFSMNGVISLVLFIATCAALFTEKI